MILFHRIMPGLRWYSVQNGSARPKKRQSRPDRTFLHSLIICLISVNQVFALLALFKQRGLTELPKEFFTLQSMLTLTGATGATFVVSNGLQREIGRASCRERV